MVTAAVLPIKTYERAKQRLSDAVGIPDRRALAEAMVGDVLDALPSVAGLDRVIAVTAEPLAAAAARDAGAVRRPRSARGRPVRGGADRRPRGARGRRRAGAARPRRLPRARPRRDRRAARPLQPRGRGDRARPPRRRHQRAAALPARRDRALVRPRLLRPPRGARARGRDRGARRRGRARSASTSTRPRTSHALHEALARAGRAPRRGRARCWRGCCPPPRPPGDLARAPAAGCPRCARATTSRRCSRAPGSSCCRRTCS